MSTTQGIPRINQVGINEPRINDKVSKYKCVYWTLYWLSVYNIVPFTCNSVIFNTLLSFFVFHMGMEVTYIAEKVQTSHLREPRICGKCTFFLQCLIHSLYKYEWAAKEKKAFLYCEYLRLSLNLFKYIHKKWAKN